MARLRKDQPGLFSNSKLSIMRFLEFCGILFTILVSLECCTSTNSEISIPFQTNDSYLQLLVTGVLLRHGDLNQVVQIIRQAQDHDVDLKNIVGIVLDHFIDTNNHFKLKKFIRLLGEIGIDDCQQDVMESFLYTAYHGNLQLEQYFAEGPTEKLENIKFMASLLSNNVENCLQKEEFALFFLKGIMSYDQLLFFVSTFLIKLANELSNSDLIRFLEMYKDHSVILLPNIYGALMKLIGARKFDQAEIILDFMIKSDFATGPELQDNLLLKQIKCLSTSLGKKMSKLIGKSPRQESSKIKALLIDPNPTKIRRFMSTIKPVPNGESKNSIIRALNFNRLLDRISETKMEENHVHIMDDILEKLIVDIFDIITQTDKKLVSSIFRSQIRVAYENKRFAYLKLLINFINIKSIPVKDILYQTLFSLLSVEGNEEILEMIIIMTTKDQYQIKGLLMGALYSLHFKRFEYFELIAEHPRLNSKCHFRSNLCRFLFSIILANDRLLLVEPKTCIFLYKYLSEKNLFHPGQLIKLFLMKLYIQADDENRFVLDRRVLETNVDYIISFDESKFYQTDTKFTMENVLELFAFLTNFHFPTTLNTICGFVSRLVACGFVKSLLDVDRTAKTSKLIQNLKGNLTLFLKSLYKSIIEAAFDTGKLDVLIQLRCHDGVGLTDELISAVVDEKIFKNPTRLDNCLKFCVENSIKLGEKAWSALVLDSSTSSFSQLIDLAPSLMKIDSPLFISLFLRLKN